VATVTDKRQIIKAMAVVRRPRDGALLVSEHVDSGDPPFQRPLDLIHPLVCPPFGPKTVGTRMKIRFPYRHQHQTKGRLHHAIFDPRNPQGSLLPIWLRNEDSSDRFRSILPIAKFLPDFLQERLHTVTLDGLNGLPVYASRTAVPTDPIPSDPKHLLAVDLVVQHSKGTLRLRFGHSIELPLKSPDLFFGVD